MYSRQLARLGDIGTHPPERSSRVHALIDACGLLGQARDQAQVIASIKARPEDLLKYHDAEYVRQLLGKPVVDSSDDSSDEELEGRASKRRKKSPGRIAEKHGLVDVSQIEEEIRCHINCPVRQDCAPFSELPDYVLEIAGSSLTAARWLKAGQCDTVINLEGGRHHAMRSRASGFCFVQDVALAIQVLTKPQPGRPRARVLYLDVDVHHGDGVEAAFRHPYPYHVGQHFKSSTRPHVLTLSLHHYAPGFFPSSGDMTPADTSHPFSLNIPLRAGTSDAPYARVFSKCVEPISKAFDPDYVVLLLGMDALAGDELAKGASNWSTDGVQSLIKQLKQWQKPMLVLGGGGYTVQRSAIGWAAATAELLGRSLPAEVPEHAFWKEYRPDFEMKVSPGKSHLAQAYEGSQLRLEQPASQMKMMTTTSYESRRHLRSFAHESKRLCTTDETQMQYLLMT